MKDFKGAINDFDKALLKRNKDVYFGRGQSKYGIGDKKEPKRIMKKQLS